MLLNPKKNKMEKIYLTENGKSILVEKIAKQTEKVREIQEEKNHAYTASGDGWHDNPGYNQLIQMEERAITELKALEGLLSNAIIWSKEPTTDKVQILSIVKYAQKSLQNNSKNNFTFELVGHGESNLKNKQISYDSLIGQALIDKQIGEKIEVKLPTGLFEIEILSIYKSWEEVKNKL